MLGAAGLLVVARGEVLLQHRAPWSHQGGTWGLPGGARDPGETAVEAALREASEETGVAAADVTVTGTWLEDHGGWSYTTVLATASAPLPVEPRDAESLEVRWVGLDDVAALPLHPSFGAAWPELRSLLAGQQA